MKRLARRMARRYAWKIVVSPRGDGTFLRVENLNPEDVLREAAVNPRRAEHFLDKVEKLTAEELKKFEDTTAVALARRNLEPSGPEPPHAAPRGPAPHARVRQDLFLNRRADDRFAGRQNKRRPTLMAASAMCPDHTTTVVYLADSGAKIGMPARSGAADARSLASPQLH